MALHFLATELQYIPPPPISILHTDFNSHLGFCSSSWGVFSVTFQVSVHCVVAERAKQAHITSLRSIKEQNPSLYFPSFFIDFECIELKTCSFILHKLKGLNFCVFYDKDG